MFEGTIFMNYLVFLNMQAGELEKILSGTKSMLLKEVDPEYNAPQAIRPGDNLYFLRNEADCNLRVKAVVTRVLTFINLKGEGLSHILKEMQTKLQLTEEQYNDWSLRPCAVLVEFDYAQKIEAIHITPNKATDRSTYRTHWIAFEELDQII
jgi:hypothetical protein